MKRYFPPYWDELRRRVYKRDRYTCQRCGKTNVKLYAHHMLPVSEGGSNKMDNLTTLCRYCHIGKHPHMIINLITTYLIIGFFAFVIIFSIIFYIIIKLHS